MARKAGAWGSVRELKTGFQARIPAVASTTNEREAIGIYPSKAEAVRALRRAEAAWERGETIPTRRSAAGLHEVANRHGVLTLTEACDTFIGEAQGKGWMFTRYADTNRGLNRRHIRDTPAGKEFVTLVSAGQVRDLLDEILEKGLSRSQALQTKALLSKTYEWLIEEDRAGGLRVSPVAGVRIRSRSKGAGAQAPRREPFLPGSVESIAAIANVVNAYPPLAKGGAPYSMTTTEFAALIRTLLFGGLRPEEALSLTVEAVRETGVWVGEVLVVDQVNHGWVLEPPKSGGRGHLVPLPPVTMALVQGVAASRGSGLLWPPRGRRADGARARMHSVPVKPWGRVRVAAGMGSDASRNEAEWRGGMQVKDLRATCASMLAAIGVTMPEARAHLGHAYDGVTTTRHYMRPLMVAEIRVIATRVEGGILERLTAAERVIDKAAKKAKFGVIGHGKGTRPR